MRWRIELQEMWPGRETVVVDNPQFVPRVGEAVSSGKLFGRVVDVHYHVDEDRVVVLVETSGS